jgi:hypothetical protein
MTKLLIDRALLEQALEALEGFVRFAAIHSDGPDASDKYLAEDYAEEAFLKTAKVLPDLRAALAQEEPNLRNANPIGLTPPQKALQREQFRAEAALRAALAQEEQEPVAWMVYTLDGKSVCVTDNPADFGDQHKALPLYTHPLRREWKGLSEEEIYSHWHGTDWRESVFVRLPAFAHAIEAALKERNHE